MGNCHLCNDLEEGNGEAYIIDTWVAKLLKSPCRYCKLLVQGIQDLEPKFIAWLLRQEYEYQGDSQPGVTYRVTVINHGNTQVKSSFDAIPRLEIVFFKSAQDNPPSCDNDSLPLPLLGEIAPVPGDAPMWEFLRSTLQTCLREHSTCSNRQDTTWFPERLLLIEHGHYSEDNIKLRLTNTRHELPQSAYIALSHCWGATQPIRTTSQNIVSHQDDINWRRLPRTFKDAVTTAQEMDVTYLWIDSLCIIQDDEEDWARNSAQMGKIYQNALFVVAAVSSSSGAEPFLGSDAPNVRYYHCAVDLASTDQHRPHSHDFRALPKARRFGMELYPGTVMGPLEQRAWAFQEEICATRMMSFTRWETKWKCGSAIGCECLGKLEKRRDFNLFGQDSQQQGTAKENSLSEWRRIVVAYSRRDLTYTSDRLPALAGIASKFHNLLESNYVGGTWEMDLPFSLGWHRTFWNPCRTMGEGAPTWSWASMQGACWWLWRHFLYDEPGTDPEIHSRVDLIQVDCSPRTSNAFGAVQIGSFIKLHGRIVEATMESDNDGHACVQRKGFIRQLVLLDCQVETSLDHMHLKKYGHTQRSSSRSTLLDRGIENNASDEDGGQLSATIHGIVYCLLLYTGTRQVETRPCVLILGRASNSDDACYQRLGIGCSPFNGSGRVLMDKKTPFFKGAEGEVFGAWEEWETWFEDVEPQSIKIV